MSDAQNQTRAAEWEAECRRWRGRVLTGRFAHYCQEWDGLPVDETCPEWDCGCYDQEILNESNGR